MGRSAEALLAWCGVSAWGLRKRAIAMNQVFFYIPNLIGYSRIVFALLSFCYASSPLHFVTFYALSQLLDALDGVAARAYNQCSSFGALLDMLTDRVSSMLLMLLLGDLYPEQTGFWRSMVVLDIVAHWMQMYLSASGRSSHKEGHHAILSFYYSFPTLFICCLGNEAYFLCCYLLKTLAPAHALVPWVHGLSLLCFPIFAFKQFTNIAQLLEASSRIAEWDRAKKK